MDLPRRSLEISRIWSDPSGYFLGFPPWSEVSQSSSAVAQPAEENLKSGTLPIVVSFLSHELPSTRRVLGPPPTSAPSTRALRCVVFFPVPATGGLLCLCDMRMVIVSRLSLVFHYPGARHGMERSSEQAIRHD